MNLRTPPSGHQTHGLVARLAEFQHLETLYSQMLSRLPLCLQASGALSWACVAGECAHGSWVATCDPRLWQTPARWSARWRPDHKLRLEQLQAFLFHAWVHEADDQWRSAPIAPVSAEFSTAASKAWSPQNVWCVGRNYTEHAKVNSWSYSLPSRFLFSFTQVSLSKCLGF